jgi:hypothetical protein
MKKPVKVPVSLKDGGLFHDTDYMRGAEDREDAARINAQMDLEQGHHRWGPAYVMEEMEPFTAPLKLVGITRSRSASAVYATFKTPEGVQFPMFLTDLEALLQDADVEDGWFESGTYEAYKRGRAYGIRRVAN